MFKDGATAEGQLVARLPFVENREPLLLRHAYVLTVAEGTSLRRAGRRLETLPDVRDISPNVIFHAAACPAPTFWTPPAPDDEDLGCASRFA